MYNNKSVICQFDQMTEQRNYPPDDLPDDLQDKTRAVSAEARTLPEFHVVGLSCGIKVQ